MLTEDKFDISGFELVPGDNSPTTGIKINLNALQNYQKASTFVFEDKTASQDAYLTNIIVSSGQLDEENPENSTYKEHNLTPTFNKETLNYEITLLEYLDTIDIKATQNDAKSSMKIKVPKRDDDGKLVYDTDGTTIIYEEKDLTNDIPLEVTINKLGEPDTNITVIVTAEDGKTINNYEVVIKRPYGTIIGSIYTEPTKVTTGLSIADVSIYSSEETSKTITWTDKMNIIKGDTLHDDLLAIKECIKQTTNDDGKYEAKVIPGKYEVLIDKAGYLDYIYINVTVTEGNTIDLEQAKLIAGDINKDGLVELADKTIMTKQNGKKSTDADFNKACDINDDLKVELADKTVVTKNNGQRRKIIDKGGM